MKLKHYLSLAVGLLILVLFPMYLGIAVLVTLFVLPWAIVIGFILVFSSKPAIMCEREGSYLSSAWEKRFHEGRGRPGIGKAHHRDITYEQRLSEFRGEK